MCHVCIIIWQPLLDQMKNGWMNICSYLNNNTAERRTKNGSRVSVQTVVENNSGADPPPRSDSTLRHGNRRRSISNNVIINTAVFSNIITFYLCTTNSSVGICYSTRTVVIFVAKHFKGVMICSVPLNTRWNFFNAWPTISYVMEHLYDNFK